MVDLEEIKNYKLEDDGTPFGGTLFMGETVGDFIESIEGENDILTDNLVDLERLNAALVQCGIKPLCI